MKERLAFAFVAFAVVAAACSGADGTPAATSIEMITTEATTAPDPAAYCAALEAMFTAQPADWFVGDGFSEAMKSYAEAIDEAAALAPDDQRGPLGDLSSFVRETAVDPTADGMLERAFALVIPMMPVQNYAQDECGLDAEALAGGGPSEPSPPVRDDISEIDADVLAAVNAMAPSGIVLGFESFITTDDEDYPVLLAAPIGWEVRDFIGTSFEPGEELGFFTQLDVGAHCNGLCAPRDWGELIEDTDFGPFSGLTDAIEVLRDERLEGPTGRLVAYREDTTITPVKVVVARWDNRTDRYFRCEARLDEDDVDLWEVFVEVCRAAIPLWIPLT